MSLKKIASMTGLSISTISHAINGTRAVSAESREAVLAAAKEIGYRPNVAARMLRTQRSNAIALIIPNGETNPNASYFYMDVIMGVRRKMVEVGCELIVSTYDMHGRGDKGIGALQVLRNQWIDGVILVPSAESDKQISVLTDELDLPFVLLDRRASKYEYSCVDSDNEGGAQDAVHLLASCGRRRIGYIGGGLGTSTGRQRLSGYKRALEEIGHTVDDSLIQLHGTFSIEQGMQAAEKLVENGADAIFAADNTMMMGAIRYLNERAITIPDQVAVIGFDDFDWMEITNPPITTIRQQATQMGYIAAEMLLRKLNGMDSNEKIVLSTRLVMRRSHGTPQAAPLDESCSAASADSAVLL